VSGSLLRTLFKLPSVVIVSLPENSRNYRVAKNISNY